MKQTLNIDNLINKLGINFENKDLLLTALTHRSYQNEHKGIKADNNERLEFLGDAVLELIVTEYLYNKFPHLPEGDLTSFRSALVCTTSLAETAKALEFGEYLKMSVGEERTGGREKDYLLANSFEAVLGAIYLDKGYEVCKSYVHKNLVPKLEEIIENRLDINSKTKFQEVAQAKWGFTPEYRVINEEGPDHEKTFTIAVYVDEKKYGIGVGPSKQKAEEEAAKEALKESSPDSTTGQTKSSMVP